MNLLKKGERAVVLKSELPALIKERLRSLGIYTGAKIKILKVSLRRNTFLVQADSARVAIDGETASGITVWKV